MLIHALHNNGYLYSYHTNSLEDVKLWFEGRATNDIKTAFNMSRSFGPDGKGMEYEAVGMEVQLTYLDGVFRMAQEMHDKILSGNLIVK